MANQGVLGLGEDTAQGIAVQRVEICDDGQTSHDLGYQAVGAEVLGRDVAQEVVAVDVALLLLGSVADDAGVEPLGNLFLNTLECASADEEDVGSIDRYHLLLRVLAAAGGGYVDDAALKELEHGLLHAFSGDIAGDGGIVTLAGYLVYLVDEDDASLGPGHVIVSGLEQTGQNALHVLAHVSCLGQHGSVDDGEGYIEHTCDSPG